MSMLTQRCERIIPFWGGDLAKRLLNRETMDDRSSTASVLVHNIMLFHYAKPIAYRLPVAMVNGRGILRSQHNTERSHDREMTSRYTTEVLEAILDDDFSFSDGESSDKEGKDIYGYIRREY